MPRPKLLYVINVDWYFRLHWLERARAARAQGFDVHLAMGITEPAIGRGLGDEGFTVHPLPLSRKSINPLLEVPLLGEIGRLLDALRPQLVHSVTIKPNIYAGILCRLRGLPLIASVTGLGTTSVASGTRGFTRRTLERAYAVAFGGRQTTVMFENRDDLRVMVDRGIVAADRALRIPGAGVATAQFRPHPEPPTGPCRVLFAARLLEDKGLRELVRAVTTLRDEGTGIELWVAGILDRDARGRIPLADIEGWAERGLLRWLGQIDDMPSLLAQVHVVCLPSRYGEGVPRILIEGAASGRPLIATDMPGCREIVRPGYNGLLVAPGRSSQLRQVLKRLADDPLLRTQMGRHGRRIAKQEYDAEIVIGQTLAHYAARLQTT